RNSTFRQAFAKRPEHWDYSWAKFRAHAMIAVLQRQCGFRYNYATTAENFPFRPEDTFVHGILFGEGGTCASLPVLYAAIGRRLGYPLKIVKAIGKRGTNSHFFCRWDDPGGERFNIETTAADGLCCLPDDYYRAGDYEVSANDEKHARLLVSLSPREELAHFVSDRGWFCMDWKQYVAAVNCFAWSWALVPENGAMKNTLIKALNEWGEGVMRLQPPGFPVLRHRWPPRYYPATLPHDLEQDIIDL